MKQHVDSANGQVDQAARDLGARALEAIDRYLTYIEKKPAGAAVEEKRQELLGQVIYYRASVYDKLEDHTKLLESLKDFESRFEKADANLLGAAIQMRIKATLGMSQAAADAGNSAEHARLLDLATKDLDVIKNVAGNTSYAGFAYQRIGFAYIALADKVREADLDAARRHERDAVKYLVPWVLRGGSLKYEHVKFVGLKCYLLGRDGDMDYTRQAARILEEAVARFPTEVETERNETDPAKQIDLKYFLAETLFKTQQWAKAVSMLRADYQKNPDSVFAIRSLGRCYYEIARQGKLDQEKYDTLIRESRLEDLGLQKAFVRIAAGGDPRKRDWMRKLAVYRSSRLFDESMQLSSGGKNALSTKDYDAYQRQWLALDDAKIAAELEKRINEYYISKLRQLQGLTEARAIALEAVLFALDRSIYYYRTVGNNTKRQSPEWWWSKYYVLASQYEQGRAHHLADPEAGAVYTQGSRILKDAEKTAENLIMLYPKLGCTEEKPDEADPEIAAAITKLRDDIKTQVSGSR